MLVLATLASYAPVWRAGFVWDDFHALHANPLLGSLEGLRLIWTSTGRIPNETHYWPVIYTAYWIEHQIWGLRPLGYHLANLTLHIVNCLLLWRLLRREAVAGAWLAATLFALHPIHVESVAWIHEFKDLASAFFYLTAAAAYLRFMHGGRRAWIGAAAGLLVAGMLTKSVVVTLPAALALWTWHRKKWNARTAGALALLLGVAAIMGALDATLASGAEGYSSGRSLVEKGLLAGRAFWVYLGRLAWPHPLPVIYPHWTIDAGAPLQYLYPLGALALVAFAWAPRRRLGDGPLVALLFYGLTLAPTLGLIDFAFQRIAWVADRYQYLASLGPIALLTATAARLESRHRATFAPGAIAAAVLLILGTLTYRQCLIWDSEVTLFRHALQFSPESTVAWNNIGAHLTRQGHLGAGVKAFQQALRLEPGNRPALDNLPPALNLAGRPGEAIAAFERVIATGSAKPSAYNDLAWLLVSAPDPRLRDAKRALALATEANERTGGANPAVLDTLAAACAANGDTARAVAIATQARQLARSEGNAALAREIERRLERYRRGLGAVEN